MIRVVLPAHLRTLGRFSGELRLNILGDSVADVLDAIELAYPMLKGTIRDQHTQKRRAYVRFFACEVDLSHDDPTHPLPQPVLNGAEPLLIIGAMSGG